MDEEDKKILKKAIKPALVFIVLTALLTTVIILGITSCINSTCVRGSLHQCCSQSFPCQQR